MSAVAGPEHGVIAANVAAALQEDVGGGDVTAALIPADTQAEATLISRESAVLCGRPWFDGLFAALDATVTVAWEAGDGERVRPDQVLCRMQGPARSILTGERAAMNFLQTLSGTATLARQYADAVAGTAARVLDTRKTLPGLRAAQKYAVRIGGCHNHRQGLFDGILIKENHIAAAGSIAAAVTAARQVSLRVPIEVEIESLGQLADALNAGGVDILLLDNFAVDDLRAAVARNNGRAKLEASGNVSLDNIRAIADTGVDYISVGALTKHVRAVDLSMRIQTSSG